MYTLLYTLIFLATTLVGMQPFTSLSTGTQLKSREAADILVSLKYSHYSNSTVCPHKRPRIKPSIYCPEESLRIRKSEKISVRKKI